MREKKLSRQSRAFLIGASLLGLVVIYVFQQANYFYFFFSGVFSANTVFIFNRTFRLVANDLLCVVLISVLFEKKEYVRVAFLLFAFELVIVMPLYFWIKLTLEGDSEISSPLLSQVHRLIVNPMLMVILIAGFYYQKYWVKQE